MRLLLTITALALGAAAPLAAQSPRKPAARSDSATRPGGATGLPAGWSVRTDEPGKEVNVKFVVMEPGYHVTLGPAAVLYRAADKMSVPFTVAATLVQTRAPTHAEGYGIFIGGNDLTGPARRYAYFLVRGDGTYLIKRREGDNTYAITSSWTRHPAVQRADAKGEATNRLEVSVTPTKLSFVVNGSEVYAADPRLVDAHGTVGLRVNHNLDVHVVEFTAKKL